jgi:predicted RNase H-like HicB family nuclease
MAHTQTLTALLIPDEDGGYTAQIAELPGAISEGDTIEEALANVREAAELYLEHATPEELAGLTAHPVTAPLEVTIA